MKIRSIIDGVILMPPVIVLDAVTHLVTIIKIKKRMTDNDLK